MTIYVVLEVGCLECDEETDVRLVTPREWEALSYYNNWSTELGDPIEEGETRTAGRWQLHKYEKFDPPQADKG